MKAGPVKRRPDLAEAFDTPPRLDPEPAPVALETVQVLGQPAIDEPPSVPPPAIPASPHPRVAKARKGSRSGSRLRPYDLADGSGSNIKQSFTGDLAFDDLWRALPGMLPRGVTRSEWAVKVLTRAARALERGKSEPPKEA